MGGERAARAALKFTTAGGVLMIYMLGDVLISAITQSTASGYSWQALSAFSALTAAFASFGAALLCMGIATFSDGRSRKIRTRKPDYALIASMEREVYGEAFRHDGAPEAVNLSPLTPLGERLTDCQPDLTAAMAALGETVRKASRSIGPLVSGCPKGHPSGETYFSLHQGALCGACEYERQRGVCTHCSRCGVLGILARGLCATCYWQVRRS